MTDLTSPPAALAERNLDAACASVAGEIGRTDGKASLLLAFNGVVLAGLASLADKPLPTPARILGALAAIAFGTACVLLLLVVRPRLGGSDRASFPHWARLGEDGIRACMDRDSRAAQVRVLSILAVGKFRRLQRAIDVSLAGLALVALAGASTVL
jgi:Pycsar effector protein